MGHILENLKQFWQFTGFANFEWGYLIMIVIGCAFIFMAIKYEWEPMLLVPIGFGILIGNIPLFAGLNVGVYEEVWHSRNLKRRRQTSRLWLPC